MKCIKPFAWAGLLTLPCVLMAGCPSIDLNFPGGVITLPGSDTVTVELINDTDWSVDPHIVFDNDSNFFAQLAPADELGIHDLAADEYVTVDFDCDELGLLFSDRPEQFTTFYIYTGYSSGMLLRGEDYDCGDVITFDYFGNGDAFDVVVSINGRVVN